MASLGDEDDDRELAASQDEMFENDNENELEDIMPDGDGMEVDGDGEPAEAEGEPDAEPGSPGNTSVVSESQRETEQPTQNPATAGEQRRSSGDATSHIYAQLHPSVPKTALQASTYDVAPTIAAPHSCSVNALTATADMRWVFSGGSDGYVRKYNWVETVNGKIMLTVAQRHPFVDSVIKAGSLMTYWENMNGNSISPVYSLAAQSEGLWLLTGLQSGNIRLQSLRHEESREIASLKRHTNAVSVLNLTSDELSALSGGWDKKIMDWDLNTGQPRRIYDSLASQISSIEIRPESTLPIPTLDSQIHLSDTFSSNYAATTNGATAFQNGTDAAATNGDMNGSESPTDSLFGGGGDSLFGDVDANGEADDMFGDVDFSKHLTNGLNGDTSPKREDTPDHTGAPERNSFSERQPTKQEEQPTDTQGDAKGLTNGTTTATTNGNGSLPHYDEPINHAPAHSADASAPSKDIKSDQVFLSASIDGNLRIWDRRQSEPVARINPKNTPPWCMDACWSPDGNYIYAGRRNGTVDEYSLHKSLQEPTRTFRFPHGSGAVSALQAMPNGRHLVCASHDILRLYDTQADLTQKHTTVPFLIIPGHRTGVVSQLYLDRACRFMLSAGGNRGWEGLSTEVLLGYEITSFQP